MAESRKPRRNRTPRKLPLPHRAQQYHRPHAENGPRTQVERPGMGEVVVINDPDSSHKKLTEIFSPDNKRKITVHELSRPSAPVMTSVDLHSKDQVQAYIW